MEVLKIARSGDWWEYKIPPLLAVGYATVLLSAVSMFSAALHLLLLLAALMVGAIYVSIINDITDIDEDLASGKANRISKIPARFRWILPALCLLAGVGFTYTFSADKLTVFLYLMAWISFSLYSIPPVRLKKRAGWGVIADASGAHLFTSLFMVSGVCFFTGQNINWIWFTSVGVWALCYGLRGILWHQFSDRENDINAGVRTFATLVEPQRFKVNALLLIVVELIAFAVMLTVNFHLITWVFLAIYVLMVLDRKRKFSMEIITVISPPGKPYQILMGEFYQIFFPLALLIIAAFHDPFSWIILLVHVLLFPKNIILIITNILELIRQEIMVKR